MPAPVALVTGRHTQIQRFADFAAWHPLHHNGTLIDQLGARKVTNIEAPIETGLADVDRDTNIGGQRRRCAGGTGQYRGCGDQQFVYDGSLIGLKPEIALQFPCTLYVVTHILTKSVAARLRAL